MFPKNTAANCQLANVPEEWASGTANGPEGRASGSVRLSEERASTQRMADLRDGAGEHAEDVCSRDPAYPSSARLSVSRPTEPMLSAFVWKALSSKPGRDSSSARICSQSRWPTLYDGAWPGQPR
jgi:hypothetical protein